MQAQLDLTFRDMTSSPSVEALVRDQLAKLEAHCPGLQSCRVVVSAPSKRHQKGGHFDVVVDLTLSGHEVVADHTTPKERHSDCHAAVRDAFASAKRELDRLHSKQVSARRQ